MAKLQSTPKTKYRNSEWLEFCKGVEQKILSANSDQTQFKNEFVIFQTKLGIYETSMTKLTKSQYTIMASLLKRKLYGLINGLYGHIKSDKTSSKSEKSQAANSLSIVVARFPYMYRLSFTELIGKSSKLINYLESDLYKDDIEKLGLTERVQAIKTTINECIDVQNKKLDESKGRNMVRKATITRAELNNAYEKLVARLNVCAAYLGDSDFLQLFGWWNEAIDQYRVIFSLRFGPSQGGKTDGGESSQPDPDTGSGDGDDDRPVIE